MTVIPNISSPSQLLFTVCACTVCACTSVHWQFTDSSLSLSHCRFIRVHLHACLLRLHVSPQGSVCEDWTTVYCCYPLAVCQMIREMKRRMKTQTYHVSTALECSWRRSGMSSDPWRPTEILVSTPQRINRIGSVLVFLMSLRMH